tara:strand:+ start:4469 stop:5059 length:591 start_codon:yes stop_codon:yes gene_type:complete
MIPLPSGPFDVIYADPPWRFEAWSSLGEDRGAVQHYDCMNLDAICSLPVGDIAARDAALFLWVIRPMLPEALRLIEAWGFTYKTVAFAWIKIKGAPGQQFLFADSGSVRKGMGYHTRSGMEQCWLATRGRGYDRLTKGEAQVHLEGIREHSRKPEHFAEAVTRLTGNVPKLEMFARTKRSDWSVWGNQVDKFGEVA